MEFYYLALSIQLFELIALVLAIIHYKKYAKTTEKFFLHFLVFTVATEFLGVYYAYFIEKNNSEIYIVYIFLSFLFYFYWFFSILKRKVFKRILVILGSCFIVMALHNFFYESWSNFHPTTFITGAFITLILSLFFFYELLNSNEVLNIKHSLRFWLAIGLLLFNIGMIPLMIFSDTFNAYNELRVIILIILNLILYSCYSVGFIWSKPSQKTYL